MRHAACRGGGLRLPQRTLLPFPAAGSPTAPSVQRHPRPFRGQVLPSALLSSPGSTATLGRPCAWRACGSWRRSVCPGCPAALSPTGRPPRPDLPSLPRLQCHLSGCMMDLFVQMAIIMGLKQTLSNCMEYLGP